MDEGLRSASACASQKDTRLLIIPRDKLIMLCDTYPQLGYRLMYNLAADLAMKISNTDLRIREQLLYKPQEKTVNLIPALDPAEIFALLLVVTKIVRLCCDILAIYHFRAVRIMPLRRIFCGFCLNGQLNQLLFKGGDADNEVLVGPYRGIRLSAGKYNFNKQILEEEE